MPPQAVARNTFNLEFMLNQTVNIVDAYKDPRFDPSVDEDTDFRHKTVLCMPIKNSEALTIGVIQVRHIVGALENRAALNRCTRCSWSTNSTTCRSRKTTRTSWKRFRFSAAWASATRTCRRHSATFLSLVTAASCVIAVQLVNSNVFLCTRYEKAIVAMAKQRVTLEVLSYHATAPAEEAGKLKVSRVTRPRPLPLHFEHRAESDATIALGARFVVPLSSAVSGVYKSLAGKRFDKCLLRRESTFYCGHKTRRTMSQQIKTNK